MEVALFLGLLIGYQLALLLDRILDKIRTLDRLKRITGLANYAMVPDFRMELPDSSSGNVTGLRSLIQDPAFEYSSYRESFRVLRTNLSYAPVDKPLVTVSVLSPGHAEGKTLINANLALSLAQVGKKVLLVDADLRKPALGPLFGIQVPENKGLPAALSGHGTWKSMVVSSGIGNLDLLPNRMVLPNTTELLSGESMKRFVAEAKNAYDYVVFDGASLLQMTDSLVLASLLDGVVLLARWNKTRSAEVGKAMEELRSVNAQVLGTLLNYADLKKGYFSAGSLSEYGHKTLAEKRGAGWKKSFPLIKKGLGIFKWFLP
ncbi:MAG TPA: CpsD/CapB family tyrosine-protein kinase, partial [bacterium]|nr:CpsD/CapB family tyrosine-protein kinase [bacterium]